MKSRAKYACFYTLIYLVSLATLHANSELVLNTTGKKPLNTPEQTGFMDLVSKQAFQRIGITLVTVTLPAERGLKNANSGIEDGEMSRIAGLSKVYPNLIQVPETIMKWEFVVFSKKNIDLSNGWDSLEPYTVAFINGWKILENNVPAGTEITRARNHEQLFRLLEKDRVDIIIYERWGGLQWLKDHNVSSVTMQWPPLAERDMYIYLHKKNASLVPLVDQALKDMKKDGSYQSIVDQVLTPLTN